MGLVDLQADCCSGALLRQSHIVERGLGMAARGLVGQLKGIVYVHSLAMLAGCPHTAGGLGNWHKNLLCSRDRYPTERHPNHKWITCLEGALLQDSGRLDVQQEFPALASVWDNPVWCVLNRLHEARLPTDDLAAQVVTQEGFWLASHAGSAMRRLCWCPEWRNLGCVLAFLGSRSKQFSPHRIWLRRHFLIFFILVCCSEPGCYVRERLFALLNGAYEGQLLGDIDDWPTDLTGFNQLCQAVEQVGAQIGLSRPCPGWDLQACTLINMHLADLLPVGSGSALDAAVLGKPSKSLTKRAKVAMEKHVRTHYVLGVPIPSFAFIPSSEAARQALGIHGTDR